MKKRKKKKKERTKRNEKERQSDRKSSNQRAQTSPYIFPWAPVIVCDSEWRPCKCAVRNAAAQQKVKQVVREGGRARGGSCRLVTKLFITSSDTWFIRFSSLISASVYWSVFLFLFLLVFFSCFLVADPFLYFGSWSFFVYWCVCFSCSFMFSVYFVLFWLFLFLCFSLFIFGLGFNLANRCCIICGSCVDCTQGLDANVDFVTLHRLAKCLRVDLPRDSAAPV